MTKDMSLVRYNVNNKEFRSFHEAVDYYYECYTMNGTFTGNADSREAFNKRAALDMIRQVKEQQRENFIADEVWNILNVPAHFSLKEKLAFVQLIE